VKYTAKLYNKAMTKYTQKSKKNLLIQSINNLTENTELKM